MCFRTSGPEHFQVPHGDVSIPERRTAADDLAGVPAGGGGELPEQGKHTFMKSHMWLSEALGRYVCNLIECKC